MKILITGASGHIGTLLRETFANNDVTLLSRKTILPRRSEKWFVSGNLWDDYWWSTLPVDKNYDVVFHLAEPVKENVNSNLRQKIIDKHVEFIRYFTSTGAKVIYPLTAYVYDRKLSRTNKIYAEIKLGVYRRLIDNKKASFPIIHPICDSGYGLGKIIQIERKIPLVNIMCAFNSSIPILRLEHLIRVFADPISMAHGRSNIFSDILPIKDLFKDETRVNISILSKAICFIIMRFTFISSIDLLIKGRQIHESIYGQ